MKKINLHLRMILLFILTGASSRIPYFLPEVFQNDLHIKASQATMVVTIGGLICTFISIPIVGLFADFFGKHKRIVLFLGIFMSLSSFILFPMFKTLSSLILGFSIIWGLLYGYRDAIDIYTSIVSEQQNLSFFSSRSWYYLGYAASSLLIGNEILLHTPTLYTIYGVIVLILCLFFATSFEDIEIVKDKNDKKEGSYKGLFKNRNFVFTTIAGFFLGGLSISFSVSMGYFVNYMSSHHYSGFNRSLIGTFTASTYFIAFVLLLLIDRISAVFATKKIAIFATILISIGSIIVWISTNVYVDFAVFLLLFSMVEPLFIFIGFDMISKNTSEDVRGLAIGLYNLIGFGLSGVIFTVGAGIIADYNAPLIFGVYAVSAILSLFAIMFTKEINDENNDQKIKND